MLRAWAGPTGQRDGDVSGQLARNVTLAMLKDGVGFVGKGGPRGK